MTEERLSLCGYTHSELTEMLDRMRYAAQAFYSLAQRAGLHQFLEITGFMNEYIKICERALAQDIDFATCTMPVWEVEAAYLGEKLGCMFHDSFAGQEPLVQAFCREAFGVKVTVEQRAG